MISLRKSGSGSTPDAENYGNGTRAQSILLNLGSNARPTSVPGLGCAKTPAVAPHVEISPSNCIPESQIILHTRGSMPCWRIVFSTFCGCMSFHTARVNSVIVHWDDAVANVRYCPESGHADYPCGFFRFAAIRLDRGLSPPSCR